MQVFAYSEIAVERGNPIPAGTPGELLHEFPPNPEGANLAVVAFGTRRVVVREDAVEFEMPF